MVEASALIQRSPKLRRLIRAAARLVNPLVLLVAGRRWMPIVGILRHRGRHSGRLYSTPLGMRPLGASLVIPRTFGEEAAWYRNLLAAGSVAVTYRAVTATFGSPQFGDLALVGAAFPRYERALFRLLGIDDFIVVGRVAAAN
jgi:deazaflavin-dependent oxidoreductase (nitroreductase family)